MSFDLVSRPRAALALFFILAATAVHADDQGYSKETCVANRDKELRTIKTLVAKDLDERLMPAYSNNHVMLLDTLERLNRNSYKPSGSDTPEELKDWAAAARKAFAFYRTCTDCSYEASEKAEISGSNLSMFLEDNVLSQVFKERTDAHFSLLVDPEDQVNSEKFEGYGPGRNSWKWDEECFEFNICGYDVTKEYTNEKAPGRFLEYCQNYATSNFTGSVSEFDPSTGKAKTLNYVFIDNSNRPEKSQLCSRLDLATMKWRDVPPELVSFNVNISENGNAATRSSPSIEDYLKNRSTPECPKVACDYIVYDDIYAVCKDARKPSEPSLSRPAAPSSGASVVSAQ